MYGFLEACRTLLGAKAGEELLALDGKIYKLDESHVVICDDKGVESIAGVMGGELSGCDENTTDVLIESALWDPLNIARWKTRAVRSSASLALPVR